MPSVPFPDHKDNPLLGMACAAAAHFMLSVMIVFAKLLSEQYNAVEISFYRNAVAALILIIYIFGTGRRDILKIRERPALLMARCFFGTFSLILTFGAFALLPLADATVLLFSSTLILPILSFFFLREQIHNHRWLAIGVGMVGIVIMAQPTGSVNPLGVAVALSAAFMHAVLGTILRRLGKSEAPITVTFYFVFVGAILSALMLPFVGSAPTLDSLPLILGLGVTGMAGQFFISSAFKYVPASVATVFTYTGIIWATLFGWMIWNDWPTTPIWTGGGIVIASNIFMMMREKYLHDRRQEEERQLLQEEKLS
jgi:drug/metabolite transporter (DMT)-like permease